MSFCHDFLRGVDFMINVNIFVETWSIQYRFSKATKAFISANVEHI